MLTFQTRFTPALSPYFPENRNETDALFFDIETTGLSAQTSYVYLIGWASMTEQGYLLEQFICTDPNEEKELLSLFFSRAKQFKLLVHYNGSSFDLPFLLKKAKRYLLDEPISSMDSLDLYALARKHRELFPLPDLKLKSMEQFFALSRTDTFGGGELIEVNAKFLGLHKINQITGGKKAAEENALLQVLLLHNAEDVKNLPSLTVLNKIANLPLFFSEQTKQNKEMFSCHEANHHLICMVPVHDVFPGSLSFSVPFDKETIEISLQKEPGSGEEALLYVSLPVIDAELKLFFENIDDYYYLPEKDSIVHKSLSEFLVGENKKKATAATCFTRHQGSFVPLSIRKKTAKQPFLTESALQRSLRSEYKSQYEYTPLTKELVNDPRKLQSLLSLLLTSLLSDR